MKNKQLFLKAISESRLGEVVTVLVSDESMTQLSQEEQESILLLSSRYERLKNGEIDGLIKESDYDVNLTKITKSVIAFINSVDSEVEIPFPEEIDRNISIVNKNLKSRYFFSFLVICTLIFVGILIGAYNFNWLSSRDLVFFNGKNYDTIPMAIMEKRLDKFEFNVDQNKEKVQLTLFSESPPIEKEFEINSNATVKYLKNAILRHFKIAQINESTLIGYDEVKWLLIANQNEIFPEKETKSLKALGIRNGDQIRLGFYQMDYSLVRNNLEGYISLPKEGGMERDNLPQRSNNSPTTSLKPCDREKNDSLDYIEARSDKLWDLLESFDEKKFITNLSEPRIIKDSIQILSNHRLRILSECY